GHPPAHETQAPSSDQRYSESWGHQARRDDRGAREWRARTGERNGGPAWKWVDELLKHEGRLSGWERQFLLCLRGLAKTARKNLVLTTAQWRCLESMAEKVGWRPKGRGRQGRGRGGRAR